MLLNVLNNVVCVNVWINVSRLSLGGKNIKKVVYTMSIVLLGNVATADMSTPIGCRKTLELGNNKQHSTVCVNLGSGAQEAHQCIQIWAKFWVIYTSGLIKSHLPSFQTGRNTRSDS